MKYFYLLHFVFVRVNHRGIAMSRALGDFRYKLNVEKGPCEQMIIPKPDVTIIERNLREDEFIVLACDGIFDIMSNSQLTTWIRCGLNKTQPLALPLICNDVIDRCLRLVRTRTF